MGQSTSAAPPVAFLASHSGFALVAGLGFALASRVLPLYSVNQNTKFLHGLARAFPERLGTDWTASTVDGLPVFSWLVYAIARLLTPLAFVALEYGLLAVLGWALYRLAARVGDGDTPTLGVAVTWVALTVLLAATPGRHLMTGVASQYLVGGYLQPSEFGVLFVLSLALIGARPRTALLLAAAPAVLHPAYIPIALLMVGVQGWTLWRRRVAGDRVVLAVALAIIVAPQVDLALRFATSDAQLQQEAMRIIAFERIPHHSLPSVWFGAIAGIKLTLALWAVWLAPVGVVRRTLVALVLFSVVGALFVAATGHAGVALLAPWRASVVVVPVSLAILLGRGVPKLAAMLMRRQDRRRVGATATALVAGLAIGYAVAGVTSSLRYATRASTDAIVLSARASPTVGRLYLTDPSDSGFRLAAMAPQFISLKSHPYLAAEVIEWRRRSELARRVFPEHGRGIRAVLDCDALAVVARAYPVSHVVVPERFDVAAVDCPWLAPAPEEPPRLLQVVRERLAD